MFSIFSIILCIYHQHVLFNVFLSFIFIFLIIRRFLTFFILEVNVFLTSMKVTNRLRSPLHSVLLTRTGVRVTWIIVLFLVQTWRCKSRLSGRLRLQVCSLRFSKMYSRTSAFCCNNLCLFPTHYLRRAVPIKSANKQNCPFCVQ